MSATKTFGNVSIVLVLVAVVAGFMPAVLHPTVPDINLPSSVSEGSQDEWDQVIVLEARHSDPSHIIRQSPDAILQVQEAIETWTVSVTNPGGQDPQKLICKIVKMANGMKYVAMWVASVDPLIGTVSVYNADTGTWITSYGGKARDLFLNGKPRGSTDSQVLDSCNEISPPPLPG